MDNLIGKKLKYKSGPEGTSEVYHVVDQKDGMITFGNNAKVSENKVHELFEEVRNESFVDSFFDSNKSGLNSIANALMNGQSIKTVGIPDSQIPEVKTEISEDTRRQYEEYQRKQAEDQRLYNARHGLSEEPVRKVMGESMREYVGEDEYEKYNGNTPPKKVASESDNLFKKMRRTTPVKIKLVLDEMLPKKDSIKHFNDMFDEDESIIDKLAKEITQKYLSNPKLIQDLIADQLESMIYPSKRKKVKKKVVKKPVKKSPVKKADVKTEENI
jgi:hypothetical protein